MYSVFGQRINIVLLDLYDLYFIKFKCAYFCIFYKYLEIIFFVKKKTWPWIYELVCPWNIIHGEIVKKITKHYHCCMLRGSIDLFYIYYDWCDKMDSKVSPSFGSPLLSTNPLVIRVLNAHEHEEPKARRIISTWEKHNYKVFFLVYHFTTLLLTFSTTQKTSYWVSQSLDHTFSRTFWLSDRQRTRVLPLLVVFAKRIKSLSFGSCYSSDVSLILG